jgi:heat shock protein HslJ
MNRTNRLTIRRLILPILLLAMFTLAGCAQEASEPTPEPKPTLPPAEQLAAQLELVGTSWVLDFVGEPDAGLTAIEGVRSTLNFLSGQYLGTGGCNWFLGVHSIDSPSLFLRPPFQTQKSCTEPVGAMEQEGLYFGALFSTTDYVLEDDKLVLYLDGTERMVTYSPGEHSDFEGTLWDVKGMFNGAKWFQVEFGSEISATFVDGKLTGSGGCNDYSADYQTDDGITIENVTSTELACDVTQEVMDQETFYLETLPSIKDYEVIGGSLALINAEGEAVMFLGAQ